MTPWSMNAGSIGGRYHFLLRRLHSLAGLVPVGLFLIFHLFTNMQMLFGAEAFQHEVEFIHLMPALLFIEITLWLSIGFHAALGLFYTFSGAKPNATAYGYADNWRYSLQRVTGVIALVFIFIHVAHFRWGWSIGGWLMPFWAEHEGIPLATASVAYSLQSVSATAFYLVGALCTVYHFANGLWTFALTWGLVISVQAQRRWGALCALVGLALAVFTIGAVVGAWMHELTPTERRALEALNEQSAGRPVQTTTHQAAQH
jgi:succinate dehydrogenase / fumarate reductase cytochrome b subunit